MNAVSAGCGSCGVIFTLCHGYTPAEMDSIPQAQIEAKALGSASGHLVMCNRCGHLSVLWRGSLRDLTHDEVVRGGDMLRECALEYAEQTVFEPRRMRG